MVFGGDDGDNFFDFISKKLGINDVTLNAEVNPPNASIKANLGTDITLFQEGSFSAIFKGLNLKGGLEDGRPSFGIGGNLILKGYDPFQSGEPDLTLSGNLALDPTSLTGKFALDAQSSWKNPFGLPNATINDAAFLVGGTYVAPFVDNFGFRGNLQFGGIALNTAFLIDITNPNKFALELTAKQPVSLVDLWAGPIGSYALQQVGNKVGFVQQAQSFLKEILDVKIVSIDGNDTGTEVDPLIKLVPLDTEIAGKQLTKGVGINGRVSFWGQEVNLNLNANPYDTSNPSLDGALQIPEIDLGFLKLTGADGANDKTVDLALKVNRSEQYLKGDAKLVLLGTEVAKANVAFTPTSAQVKDFDLNFGGIVALDVDNLSVDLAKKSAAGSAKLKFFGQDIAGVKINLDSNGLKAKANLNLFGVLAIENATVEIKSPTDLKIAGTAKIFGQNLGSANISIQNGKLNVTGNLGVDLPVVGNVGATLSITSDGSPGGSKLTVGFNGGPLGGFDYTLNLAPLRSIDDVFDQAADYAFGLASNIMSG